MATFALAGFVAFAVAVVGAVFVAVFTAGFVTLVATFLVVFVVVFVAAFAAVFVVAGFAGVRADRTSTISRSSELVARDDALRFVVGFAERGVEGGVSAAIRKRGKSALRTLSARSESTSMRGVWRVRARARIAWMKPPRNEILAGSREHTPD